VHIDDVDDDEDEDDDAITIYISSIVVRRPY
jgi:hypothetical protein